MIYFANLPSENFKAISKQKDASVYFFFYEPTVVLDEEGKDTGTVNCTVKPILVYEPTYEVLVTKCIEVKYTLDAQVALLYNYQNDTAKYQTEMDNYQEWRTYCKNACKEFFGTNNINSSSNE